VVIREIEHGNHSISLPFTQFQPTIYILSITSSKQKRGNPEKNEEKEKSLYSIDCSSRTNERKGIPSSPVCLCLLLIYKTKRGNRIPLLLLLIAQTKY